MRTLILAAVVFALPALAHAERLTGRWCGTYIYPGAEAVPFTLDVVEKRRALTGAIREPNTFGDPSARELGSTISGKRRGAIISFRKTYDGKAGASHSVDYAGRLNGDGSIAGEWDLGGTTGGFAMRRCSGALVS
jgi:hypothetical protein